jgi:lanosterol synthase
MFLLPGLVIGSYAARMTFLDEERLEMIRYLFNRAHPDDGGWGLYVCFPHLDSSHGLMVSRHIEGPSTAMGTALNYATLRLLGVPADHPVAVRARATLHKLGGQDNSKAFYSGLLFFQAELKHQPPGPNSGFLS